MARKTYAVMRVERETYDRLCALRLRIMIDTSDPGSYLPGDERSAPTFDTVLRKLLDEREAHLARAREQAARRKARQGPPADKGGNGQGELFA